MKKLANVFFTITAGVFMTFLIIKIMPGDPVTILANELRSTQGISEADAMSRAISMLNYDPSQPLLQQRGDYSFLHGGYTNRFDGCMVQE